MNLAVLGERVFIRPDKRPEYSESGLSLIHDRASSTVKGTVVALGEGPADRRKAVQKALTPLIARMTELAEDETGDQLARAVVASLRAQARAIVATYRPDHLVAVGDTVLFSPDAGEELYFERDVIIAMREADILAVVEPDEPVVTDRARKRVQDFNDSLKDILQQYEKEPNE